MKRSVKQLKKEYETAVQQASIVAFIATARRHPDVTLGELGELAVEYGLGELSIHRMFVDENFMDFSTALPKALPAATKRKAAKTSDKKDYVTLRTVKQREAYRLKVLDANTDEWQAAPEIQSVTSGTPAQVRSTLNSLIEEGLLSFKGQARGTRYKLTKNGKKAKGK